MNRFALNRWPTLFWLVVVSGCGSCERPPDVVPPPKAPVAATGLQITPELVALNNRGVALMGMYDQAKNEEARVAFADIVKKQPKWTDAQVNLAIATLNENTPEREAEALDILATVLKADPKNLRAHYCTGLLLFNKGQATEAQPHFQTVAQADPADAFAAYYIGRCLFDQGQIKDALPWLEAAERNNPYLISASHLLGQALLRLDRGDEAQEEIDRHARLKTSPYAQTADLKYGKMGPKANAIALGAPQPAPKLPDGPLFAEPAEPNVMGADQIAWTKFDANSPDAVSITACDIDGDGQMDLFLAGAITTPDGPRNAVLLRRSGGYVLDTKHPLAAVSDVRAALWGDYDNDGLTDVYFCRRGENQLWRQVEKGKWQDITAETKTGGGDLDTVDGALVDADHDGDLDLILIHRDGPNELLGNNLNGTFSPLGQERAIPGDGRASRQVVVADLDADRDLDLFVVHDKPPHELFLNDRLWTYQAAKDTGALAGSKINAAVAADADSDGQVELYTLLESAVTRWTRGRDGAWQGEALELETAGHAPGFEHLAIADVDGDGRPEVIFGDSGGWQVSSIGKKGATRYRASGQHLAGWALAVLDPIHGPAVVGVRSGQPPLVWQSGPGRFPFAALKLTGKENKNAQSRSNASGIGARIAARIDSRWVTTTTLRNQSGPGQSLEPALIGTGGASQIDFVDIRWSGGVSQVEMALDAAKLQRIEETQREPVSCPLIFIWNGSDYQFVTDFLGVGGLGYATGPGQYATPQPRESILLPPGALVPQEGRYRLKLLEPGEEATYLDAVRLTAYDLPPLWSMTLDERMGGDEPASGQPRFFRNEQLPASAVNDRGEDVTAAVHAADRRAAPPGQRDPRFIGLVAEHSLTLTFDQSVDSRDGDPILVIDGWIEFPYSQTVIAALQAGERYVGPSLEAQDENGQWQVVAANCGMPGGMPRQLSIPLKNVPAGAKSLRLRTNQEIYWDRIAMAWCESCPEVNTHSCELRSARLHRVGFPKRSVGPQQAPGFDYNQRRSLAAPTHPEGIYTAFGPVDELVRNADDALAIFGPGEEIDCQFAAADREPASGWTRRLMLETEGWCKDTDVYTKDGQSIEPLPTRGTLNEAQARQRDRLHEQYNRRYQAGR